jgi:hydrogenase maturation factor
VTADGCEVGHCITCSDEGIQMRALARDADGLAECADADGTRAVVMTDLVGPVAPGDRLLVHAGVALTRLEAAAEAAA